MAYSTSNSHLVSLSPDDWMPAIRADGGRRRPNLEYCPDNFTQGTTPRILNPSDTSLIELNESSASARFSHPMDLNVFNVLTGVLSTSRRRKAMQELRGDSAQTVVDYLYMQGLNRSSLPKPGLRKHIIIALYKLCKASMLYPQCFALRDITVCTVPETGGGFCDIYRGHFQTQCLCVKAVRTFKKPETEVMLKIFAKEAILWGQLHHPNILPFYGIYHLDELQNRICLVSPWMEKGNLVEFIRLNPHLQRTSFICDIAKGLDYLHDENIIHGDLKGANILISDSGTACITDFGLSSVLVGNTFAYTRGTSPIGCSSRWLAPEHLKTNQRTQPSDIWAFGSVCYEILSRRLPYFECTNELQVFHALLFGRLPTRPRSGTAFDWDEIGDEMWGLMNVCWVSIPDQRPTCKEILIILERLGICHGKQEQQSSKSTLEACEAFRSAMCSSGSSSIDLSMVMNTLTAL